MERVKTFFTANDITTETKKRAVLLSSMSEKAYTTLCSLTTPKMSAKTSWTDILKFSKNYYTPQANPIVDQ